MSENTIAAATDNPVRRSRAMLILVPAAIVAIGGSVLWKANRSHNESARRGQRRDMRACPSFELSDQDSHMVRLESYLHRHSVVLVFFDAKKGAAANPWLHTLNMNPDSIESGGIIVFGVSTALPQHNRIAEFKLPLLSEVNPARPVHKQWGAIDNNGNTLPKMFYINRERKVQFDGQTPRPVDRPGALVRAILEGRDPETVL